MPPFFFLLPRLAEFSSSSSSVSFNAAASSAAQQSPSNSTSPPPCPDSPSSGTFSEGCTPISNAYPSPYSPAQLAVIGAVSCAAVLVAVGAFLWWAWKWRRRSLNSAVTVSVGLAGSGAASQPPTVPPTIRIPKSAFARRTKRINPLHASRSGSEHELQPATGTPGAAAGQRLNPDGTVRDMWDEEGLDTMATFETGETLVVAEKAGEGEAKVVEEGDVVGEVGEVPLSIQRLTLGPLSEPSPVQSPTEPTPPSPAYHPPSNGRDRYTALPAGGQGGRSVPNTPTEARPPAESAKSG